MQVWIAKGSVSIRDRQVNRVAAVRCLSYFSRCSQYL
jgi:hypothetical protein